MHVHVLEHMLVVVRLVTTCKDCITFIHLHVHVWDIVLCVCLCNYMYVVHVLVVHTCVRVHVHMCSGHMSKPIGRMSMSANVLCFVYIQLYDGL